MADLLSDGEGRRRPPLATASEPYLEHARQLRADYGAPLTRRLMPAIYAATALLLIVAAASTEWLSSESPDGHFMSKSLLQSQFEAPEERAITIWVGKAPALLVDVIVATLAEGPPDRREDGD